MSGASPVRTPDGLKRNLEAAAEVVSITDADSPYTMGANEYLIADSTAGPISVNLPDAKQGGEITVNHPAGVANDVTVVAESDQTVNGGALGGNLILNTNGFSTFRAARDAGVFGWYTA